VHVEQSAGRRPNTIRDSPEAIYEPRSIAGTTAQVPDQSEAGTEQSVLAPGKIPDTQELDKLA
jgi:hypothetical protein